MAEHVKSEGDVRLGVHLTAAEKARLDELVVRRYPDRKRMHSVVIGELINEIYRRELPRSSKE